MFARRAPEDIAVEAGSAESSATAFDPVQPSLLIVATIARTIELFLTPYATHFRELGWRVDAAANGAPSSPTLARSFDNVYDLPLSRSIFDVGGLIRSMRAMSMALESRPDIVHVHTPIAAFIARAAIRRLPTGSRPMVAYTAHGFHFHPAGRRATNALFLTAERIAGRWTDRLVVINDDDFEQAQKHRIVPSRRLVYMPGIGVDANRYSRKALQPAAIASARVQAGAEPEEPLFVAIGELNRNKRMADVITALGRMKHREAKLAIAGEGPEGASLEALIDSLGLRDRVRLVGNLVDVRPFIAGGVAQVLASAREGLPRSIMEGLLLEVPAIVSAARGSRDLVNDQTGITFAIGDIAGLAAAMDRVVDQPLVAREMGRRGRARIRDRFELSTVMLRHDEMYDSMLAERGGKGPSDRSLRWRPVRS